MNEQPIEMHCGRCNYPLHRLEHGAWERCQRHPNAGNKFKDGYTTNLPPLERDRWWPVTKITMVFKVGKKEKRRMQFYWYRFIDAAIKPFIGVS